MAEQQNKVLSLNKVHEVENYPYGKHKTRAYFSVEFVKVKGFRHVFQTVNPKNGKLNASKLSTYKTICWNELNMANGHIEVKSKEVYGYKEINEIAKFLFANFDALELTPLMVEDICGSLMASIRANLLHDPKNLELFPLFEPVIVKLVEGVRFGSNIFSEVILNLEEIEKIKKSN